MFCEKCGGLTLPKNGLLTCSRCGHKIEIDDKESLTQVKDSAKTKKVVILDDESKVSTLPITRAECSQCNNMEAYWWLVQTRRADEPETRFLRCTMCKFTWREYD